jgi:hypothetical protein
MFKMHVGFQMCTFIKILCKIIFYYKNKKIRIHYIEWWWAVINTTKYNLLAKRWRLAGNYMFWPFIVAMQLPANLHRSANKLYLVVFMTAYHHSIYAMFCFYCYFRLYWWCCLLVLNCSNPGIYNASIFQI